MQRTSNKVRAYLSICLTMYIRRDDGFEEDRGQLIIKPKEDKLLRKTRKAQRNIRILLHSYPKRRFVVTFFFATFLVSMHFFL